jgi:phage terminase large subunit
MLPHLTVDPSCVNTIAEFESYQYPSGGKVEKDVPIKANDHAMDALRYLAMELMKPHPKAVPVVGQQQRSKWSR